jgi:hypothetical protein
MKVGVARIILEKNHCSCEQMVNNLFMLVPHLALQHDPVLQLNHHCVGVDPLDILKQEELFFL